MCLSIQWWRQQDKEGSRCLQLQTRLWGGVDGGGACRGCVRGDFGEGYRGVTAGSGGGSRGRVGSYDLKKPFLWSVCQRAPQQTQSQVSLVLLAELMRACTLRAGALMFWVVGSLCFLSRSPSLPVPHQKWKGSWEADVLKHVFIQSTLYSPPAPYPVCPLPLHFCCMYSKDLSPHLYIQLNTLNRLTLYI